MKCFKIANILFLLATASHYCSGQVDNIKVEQYVKKVDSLKALDQLIISEYENMSYCGGSLKGFYRDSDLVYIKSTYSAETGYSSKNIYYIDNKAVKIIYHQHFAEWDKYYQKYPEGEGEFGKEYEHMTYTDTTYIIYPSESDRMYKYSKGKYINTIVDHKIYEQCTKCARSMKLELEGKTKDAFELIRIRRE